MSSQWAFDDGSPEQKLLILLRRMGYTDGNLREKGYTKDSLLTLMHDEKMNFPRIVDIIEPTKKEEEVCAPLG